MRGDKDRMEAKLAKALKDGQAKVRETETAQHALQTNPTPTPAPTLNPNQARETETAQHALQTNPTPTPTPTLNPNQARETETAQHALQTNPTPTPTPTLNPNQARETETAQHALQMLTDDFVTHEATLRRTKLQLEQYETDPATNGTDLATAHAALRGAEAREAALGVAARVLGRELRTHDEVVISRLEEQSCEVAEMQARCTQMHPDAIRCTQMHPDTPRLQREEEEGTAPLDVTWSSPLPGEIQSDAAGGGAPRRPLHRTARPDRGHALSHPRAGPRGGGGAAGGERPATLEAGRRQ
jgi:hypothetical protein